jgi:threonine dehydrogenase-like Zn-dependent dehydrogenase
LKALVLEQYRGLVYTDVPDPVPQRGEVLVRVAACGICSSDVHGLDGSTGRRIPPIIMGHEGAGTIVAVGPGVSEWRQGQRVTFGCAVHCGTCSYCRRGWINLCDNRRWIGVSAPGAHKDGAYAEYVAIPQQILVALPPGLSFTAAALTEPLSVAAHALARTPRALYDSALVVGCGPIGLLAIQLLRRSGCGRIVAVDRNPPRLALAERCGAHVMLGGSGVDVAEGVRLATHGQGVDLALEAAGSESALHLCVDALRKGGSLTLIGNVLQSVSFPLQAAVVKELTMYSAMTATDEMPRCVEMLAGGVVDVQPLINFTAPLSQGVACFERLRSRDRSLVKIILAPDE